MKDPRFPKLVLFVNALVPLAILGWDAYHNQLGPDPIKSSIHTTGMLALIFLLLSLCVTPVRMISGWNWLSHFRRMLGLYAFFYGCVHFFIYFGKDREWSIDSLIAETLKRKFIFFGMTALTLMIPLAITSTNGMIKRLGSAKWKRLHQLVYISAIAAVFHFCMSTKLLSNLQMAFAVALAILLAYRPLGPRIKRALAKPDPRRGFPVQSAKAATTGSAESQ